MSSFSEIATNLDQRITALETYFNSLKTKGCPRASCGEPQVGDIDPSVKDLNTSQGDYIISPKEGEIVASGTVTFTVTNVGR